MCAICSINASGVAYFDFNTSASEVAPACLIASACDESQGACDKLKRRVRITLAHFKPYKNRLSARRAYQPQHSYDDRSANQNARVGLDELIFRLHPTQKVGAHHFLP